jgi:hypothetical protein
MDTTAIIQFIGIVLFSAQVPNDPGVHAIIPRIGHDHQQTVESFVDGVEEHKAVILYRKEDLLHTGGWRADHVLHNGWEYVELDGERVEFVTDGRNGAAEIPLQLPHTGGGLCSTYAVKPSLSPQFQAPYRGAVGVVDIPFGTMNACESGAGSRVDTRLFIRTKGILIISAKKQGERAKTISLDEDAVVYVANVPPSFLTDDPEIHRNEGEPHWDAYNDMLGQSCSARPDPAKPVGLETCDMRPLTEAYRSARNNPPTKGLPNILDSECSNSQWP